MMTTPNLDGEGRSTAPPARGSPPTHGHETDGTRAKGKGRGVMGPPAAMGPAPVFGPPEATGVGDVMGGADTGRGGPGVFGGPEVLTGTTVFGPPGAHGFAPVMGRADAPPDPAGAA